jgi:hypothetical protein
MNPPPSNPSSPPAAFPFTPQDALEFMQKMWNPLGVPIPGFAPAGTPMGGQPGAMPFPNPAAMFATLDPAELDRKIAEMRVIENWLTMTLNLMQMSIKTMELQKASLEALRAAQAPPTPPAAPSGGGAPRRKS